ncbi:hypothetical protein QR680_003645 [Steinernema hermaphroditum]|uniref:7TM GPCR serpentine receptor class x (Srx) domain-containing protein n=1 Tax=Steinernema hermaphroditum TaxID=289476 RepID=A0AA39HL27_9BILA|nr:hypothetical protein QR680_003645 [Steinernema hermaphroditum]
MTSSNVSEKFVWGSELEGRGVMTTFDTMVGVSIWALTISAVVIGILNLQPKDIPPTFGVTIFMIGYFFASESCIMHQFVSANRMLAVCAPLKYDSLFNRKVTRNCIIFAWSAVTVLMSLYIENRNIVKPFRLALILFNPEVRRLFRGKSKTVTNSVEPFADQTTVAPPPQEPQ